MTHDELLSLLKRIQDLTATYRQKRGLLEAMKGMVKYWQGFESSKPPITASSRDTIIRMLEDECIDIIRKIEDLAGVENAK